MKYDFNKYIERRGSGSMKWDLLEERFGSADLCPLWVADMDFRSPPEVLEALTTKLQHGIIGYPTVPDSLFEAVINWQETRHGWNVDKESVSWCPGVVAGLAFSLMAYTKPGDGVIIQPPVYPPFHEIIEEAGRRVVMNPLKRENGRYTFDLEHLGKIITPTCRVLILCSPHNPVMRVWTREELTALAELAKRKDMLVLSDEIHQDIVYKDAKHFCFASLSEDAANRSLTFVAPSKTFNLAGLASSVAIIPNKSLRMQYQSVLQRLHLFRLNMMGLIATETAYAAGAEWCDEMMEYLEDNRNFVETFVKERMPKAKMDHPEGTYIFWIDFRGYGLSGDVLQELLVKKAGVALNDGRTFGAGGDGFARLNIGTTRAQLKNGLERIAKALEKI